MGYMNPKRFLLKLSKMRHNPKKQLAETQPDQTPTQKIAPTLPTSVILPSPTTAIPQNKIPANLVPPISSPQVQSSQYEPMREASSQEFKRVEIPRNAIKSAKRKKDVTAELRKVNETYNLVTTQLGKQSYSLAYTRIKYNQNTHQLDYFVVEPQINEHLKKIVERTKEELHEKLDIDFGQLKAKNEVYKYVNAKIDEIWSQIGLRLSPKDTLDAKYFVLRDTIGLNEIEALMQDPNIEDIGCDGIGLPVFIFHRNPLYGDITTNIKFDTEESLDAFVMKLAQKCGRTVSVATPLMDGTLQDGSLDYNEDVVYKKNGIVKVAKIGDVIDKVYGKNESNKPVRVVGFEVPAFDRDSLKVKWMPVDYVYRHGCDEDLYKLELETGRSVTLTGAHSIFTLKSKGVLPERTENVNEGDYVAIPLKIPENKKIKEINLAEALSKKNYAERLLLTNVPHKIYHNYKTEIKEYIKGNCKFRQQFDDLKTEGNLPLKLYTLLSDEIRECKIKYDLGEIIPSTLSVSRELMRLLGFYVAEGCTSKAKHCQVHFESHKLDLIKDIKQCIEKCFPSSSYVESTQKKRIKLKVSGFALWDIFNDVLKVNHLAKDKRVPELVYNVSKDLQREFVSGWWLGNRKPTADESLISDMLYLSLFNDESSSSNHNREISIQREMTSLREDYTQRLMKKERTNHPNMIPIEIFNPLKDMHSGLKDKQITRERLGDILLDKGFERFLSIEQIDSQCFSNEWEESGLLSEGRLTKKGSDVVEELRVIKKLLNSDLGFAKVKKISKTKSTSKFVYDFSVKGHENFVGGVGGVCCHNSRVQITYGTDIARKGSNFTIRKFFRVPLTPVDLINFGTIDAMALAYLWLAIEKERSILIAGTTATGKTTMLNAISLFIPAVAKVVSIEDTAELQLTHTNWVPQITRPGTGKEEYGEISMYTLLKSALRQRPDYLIVGEVRGAEASVLFQAMATGHPSLSTLHADNVLAVIHRLTSKPIDLPLAALENLDIIIFLDKAKKGGKFTRHVSNIIEIEGFDYKSDQLLRNEVFAWSPKESKLDSKHSSMLATIAEKLAWPEEDVKDEIVRRASILTWLKEKGIYKFDDVAKVVHMYYTDPVRLENLMNAYGFQVPQKKGVEKDNSSTK